MPIRKELIDSTDSRGTDLKRIDATKQVELIFNVEGSNYVAFQFVANDVSVTGAYSGWTIDVSLNGVNYNDVKVGAVTFTMTSSPHLTDAIDVSVIRYIRARNSTVSTNAREILSLSMIRADTVG